MENYTVVKCGCKVANNQLASFGDESAYCSEHNKYEVSTTKRKNCNICGKDFDMLDAQMGFGFKYKIGYGSKYDLYNIRLHMCCDCFDNVLDYILPQCKINPLKSYKL